MTDPSAVPPETVAVIDVGASAVRLVVAEVRPDDAQFGDAPRDVIYTVTDIYPEHIVLDANHPLAGIALRLSLTVEAVREATEEEIGRGSAGTGFFRIAPPHEMTPGNETRH